MKNKNLEILLFIGFIILLVFTTGFIYLYDLAERCENTTECLPECGCKILSECNIVVDTDKIGQAIGDFAYNGTCGDKMLNPDTDENILNQTGMGLDNGEEKISSCSEFCGGNSDTLTGTTLNGVCMCYDKTLDCYPAQLGTSYLICGSKNESKRLI